MVRNLSPFLWKGEAVKNHLPPSRGRGMPEGQGVGRRRKRVKPASGALRRLLPEEGGRIIFPVVEKEQNRSCHPIV